MTTVVVTGIADGLGRTLAADFARGGAVVYGCDINADNLASLSRELPHITTVAADVSVPRDIDRFFSVISAHSESIDILVNNVGIAGPRAPIEEISLDDWRSSMDANLLGAFLCIRHVLPDMKRRRSGCIVNVSTGSVRTLPIGRSPYIVSKAALESLTKAVAREVGPFGIRCNAVQPGMMDNARLERVLQRVADQSGKSVREVESELLQFVSTRRKVSMSEVAAMITFLATDQAQNITGQIIAVDGGIEWEA